MRDRLGRLPLRVRLVAGFVAAMLVLLSAAGGFVYWRVEYALDRGLDVELDRATATISPLVDPAGRVTSPSAADATGTAWQVLDAEGRVLDAGGAAPADPLVPAGDLAQVGTGTLITEVGDLLPAADRPYRLHITALGSGPSAGSACPWWSRWSRLLEASYASATTGRTRSTVTRPRSSAGTMGP